MNGKPVHPLIGAPLCGTGCGDTLDVRMTIGGIDVVLVEELVVGLVEELVVVSTGIEVVEADDDEEDDAVVVEVTIDVVAGAVVVVGVGQVAHTTGLLRHAGTIKRSPAISAPDRWYRARFDRFAGTVPPTKTSFGCQPWKSSMGVQKKKPRDRLSGPGET